MRLSEVIDYYIISDADANKPRSKLYLLEHTLLLRVLFVLYVHSTKMSLATLPNKYIYKKLH